MQFDQPSANGNGAASQHTLASPGNSQRHGLKDAASTTGALSEQRKSKIREDVMHRARQQRQAHLHQLRSPNASTAGNGSSQQQHFTSPFSPNGAGNGSNSNQWGVNLKTILDAELQPGKQHQQQRTAANSMAYTTDEAPEITYEEYQSILKEIESELHAEWADENAEAAAADENVAMSQPSAYSDEFDVSSSATVCTFSSSFLVN